MVEDTLKKYAGKHVLLAWSGGLDSNVMLFELLRNGAIVTAVSLDYDNLPNNAVQREVRERVIKRLQRLGLIDNFRHADVMMRTCLGTDRIALGQLALLQTMLMNNTETHIEHVLQAYVMGDDAVSYIPELKGVWKSFKALWRTGITQPTLDFPFIKVHKIHLAQYLNENDASTGLNHVSWTCEYPAYKKGFPSACGECPSCNKVNYHKLQQYHLGYNPLTEYDNPLDIVTTHRRVSFVYYHTFNDEVCVWDDQIGDINNVPFGTTAAVIATGHRPTKFMDGSWAPHRARYENDISALLDLPWDSSVTRDVLQTLDLSGRIVT